jgi:hypothetical protein
LRPICGWLHHLVAMNEAELQRFRAFANATPEFQTELSRVLTPSELVNLAHARGFELTVNDLLIGARDWNDSHWLWAGKGKQFFRFFFHEGRLPGPGELSGR